MPLERQFLDWGDSGSKRDGPDATQMGVEMIRRFGRVQEVRHNPRERAAAFERHLFGDARDKHQPFGRKAVARMGGW